MQSDLVFLERRRLPMPWQDAHRTLPAEEFEQRLEDGSTRLAVRAPDAPEHEWPVRTPDDLRTLDPLYVEEPKDPECVSLRKLVQHGWKFTDGEGQAVGLYGAHLQTEETFARRGEVRVPLAGEGLDRAASFYRPDNPLAACEEQGYQFF